MKKFTIIYWALVGIGTIFFAWPYISSGLFGIREYDVLGLAVAMIIMTYSTFGFGLLFIIISAIIKRSQRLSKDSKL